MLVHFGELFQFNMEVQLDRLRFFKVLVNIIRFFHGCHHHRLFPIPPEIKLKKTPRSFNTFVNVRGDTETGDVVFVKTFEKFDSYEATNPNHLIELFKILRVKKTNEQTGATTTRGYDKFIPHTYKNFTFGIVNDSKKGKVVVVESTVPELIFFSALIKHN